jgi:phosphoribosylformimino-5-aminoimidazole carboxamide ribotide isomerase
MLLIPAIDLKDGKCVRLQQGDMQAVTTFGDDPAAMARRWLDAGARRLHLVDLNGAFAGKPVNEAAVKSILREVDGEVPVQLGGGIRDLDTIGRYLDDGIEAIIIGTAAVKSPGFLKDACSAFGGHIIVGRDGMMTGINIEATVKLARALRTPVVASGGLAGLADIEQLCAVASEGISGVICGRSIYTGALDFAAAQERADELADADD